MIYADIDNTLKDKKTLSLEKSKSNIIRKLSLYAYVLYIPGQYIVILLHADKKAKGEKVHQTWLYTLLVTLSIEH